MLQIENLVKSYPSDHRRWKSQRGDAGQENPSVYAVDDISLEIRDGEMFTLLGPSGCGKTTTLRSIAGLEHPDAGVITLNGRTLFTTKSSPTISIPANKRGLGMVFQSYAIWPHMTVFDNVAFPLQVVKRSRRPGKREIAKRVTKVLETMELADFAHRQSTKLSGGQQQRLALARALVMEPPLLLLDEPLSNLDAKLRESLRYELKRMQRELGITCVYVTHDQVEALSLSTTIAVMKAGKVMQIGRPRDVYENPNSKFVAEFIGSSNFVSGVIVAREGKRYSVNTDAGRLVLLSSLSLSTGQDVVVSIRPEIFNISTTSRGGEVINEWPGRVVARAFLGDALDHVVSVGKHELRVRGNPSVSIDPGTVVYLQMEPASLSLVPVD